MNIIQIGSSLIDWGGIERYIYYLSQGVSQLGHDVKTFCPPGSPLEARLSSAHQATIPFRLKAQFQYTLLPKYLRVMREIKPDIVHTHFSPDFIIPSLAARKSGAKVVLTRHLAIPWKPKKARRYNKLFDCIIPVSDAVYQELLKSGIEKQKLRMAKAGVPALAPTLDRLETESTLSCDTKALQVGFFARLVPEKGIRELLQISEDLGDQIQMHIFGDGPLKNELSANYSESKRVIFHGQIAEVANAMNAMDVIAVPSIWAEAFPYSILEAMSMGKTVLASQVGGIPEMVANGETGILLDPPVTPLLRKKWVDAIAQIAQNQHSLQIMGDNARKLHRENYTVEAMATRIESVYRNLLESA